MHAPPTPARPGPRTKPGRPSWSASPLALLGTARRRNGPPLAPILQCQWLPARRPRRPRTGSVAAGHHRRRREHVAVRPVVRARVVESPPRGADSDPPHGPGVGACVRVGVPVPYRPCLAHAPPRRAQATRGRPDDAPPADARRGDRPQGGERREGLEHLHQGGRDAGAPARRARGPRPVARRSRRASIVGFERAAVGPTSVAPVAGPGWGARKGNGACGATSATSRTSWRPGSCG